jgi:CRP-like cAMP-binding protein
MRTDVNGRQVKNVILLSLPDAEYSLIRPHLESVDLPHHTIMHEPGEKIEYGYFLNEGMTSLVVLTSDGRSVEVGIVGREGVVGTPLAVGLHRGPCRAIMQIPGSGLRLKAGILEDTLVAAPELRMAFSRYALMQGLQVAQIAACNRLHEIEQRLARWLLMCQDRVDSQSLHLTQDFMAQMLGTGRPTVSLAAGILQRAGLITQGRQAQWRPRRLQAGPLREVADWVSQYRRHWEESFERLDTYLREVGERQEQGNGEHDDSDTDRQG